MAGKKKKHVAIKRDRKILKKTYQFAKMIVQKADEFTKKTIEKEELKNEGEKHQRVLRRRASEQSVVKILKDNLAGFSSYQIDDKTNSNGNTLRMQLRLDRKNPQLRMGLK